jgi:hypothetical protein
MEKEIERGSVESKESVKCKLKFVSELLLTFLTPSDTFGRTKKRIKKSCFRIHFYGSKFATSIHDLLIYVYNNKEFNKL